MRQKPSKRTLKKRQERKWLHEANNAWHSVVTLGNINVGDTVYFDCGDTTWTFPDGSLITVDAAMTNFGTKVMHGKNPKNVHPARRNKEKKKIRIEANISAGGQTATIIKVDSDTWQIVHGTNGTIV